jgi:hypothetical protein
MRARRRRDRPGGLSYILLLAVLPLRAADDANAILRRFIDAEKQNDERARQYTYVEDAAWFILDKSGHLFQNRSETHEVIFVEGLTYKKLVARDGKPIDAKEQAQVEKTMRQTAEQRRKHPAPAPGGKIASGRASADFGSNEELLTLFENRLIGEEEIGGRKAWVIESKPQKGRLPANRHEKGVFSFSKKLWIDEADNVMLRAVYTVTGDHIFIKPGSAMTVEFQKVNQDAWQPALFVIDARKMVDKNVQASSRTEYRYSKFQKFDVQSTITLDPPK